MRCIYNDLSCESADLGVSVSYLLRIIRHSKFLQITYLHMPLGVKPQVVPPPIHPLKLAHFYHKHLLPEVYKISSLQPSPYKIVRNNIGHHSNIFFS